MNETIRTILLILLFSDSSSVSREKRSGFSKADYIRHFEEEGFKETLVETIPDRRKEFLAEADFQLNPKGDYQEDHKIVNLDNVELIKQICNS